MDFVDWDLASRIGRRVAPKGPDVEADVAREVVVQLRDSAERAGCH